MKNLFRAFLLLIVISMASVAYAQTEVYFSPNGGCQEAVVKEIGKAHKSIDIAMYALTSREIAQALLKAKERQIKIKIVLDKGQIKDYYSKSKYLAVRGFDIKFKLGPGLMHNKFAVIDDHIILTGSYNWTVTADKKNSENLLVITDNELANKYTKQFKTIWGQSGEAGFSEGHSLNEKK